MERFENESGDMSSGGAASEPLLNSTSIEALAALGKSLDLSGKDLQDFIVQQQEFEREERRSVREERKTELELSNRQKERESEERRREVEAQERQRVCDAEAEERQKQRERLSTIWLLQTYVMKNLAGFEEKLKEVSDRLLWQSRLRKSMYLSLKQVP